MSDLPHTLVLILGLLGISKAVWALFATDSFSAFASKWKTAVARVPGIIGLLALILGFALLASFMIYRPIAHWILLAFGLIYILFGASVWSPSSKLARLFNPPKSKFALRFLAIIAIVVCSLLIWVAIADL